jgi:aldehyde:ferredoxin oxidoreductase
MSGIAMHAYMGKILRVDLSAEKTWEEPLNESYAKDYLGGSGLAARYLFDLVDEKTDPLGPHNPLIFMTGPLVGTAFSCSGRHSVCGLSPLTGIWGEANSGGFFGPELRFAGFDGILITGRARYPVWISIKAGRAELHEAANLWGLDTYLTQLKVKERMNDLKARVACIGQAGENQVKMAAVMNDHGRAAARTGMGAVMGSKNLKAIGVRGTGKIPLANPDEFKATVLKIIADTREDLPAQSLRLAGTGGYLNLGVMYGDLPMRYYQQGNWEQAQDLSGVVVATRYQNRNTACYRCPIACGRETRSPAHGVEKVDGPEYETLAALGALNLVSSLEDVIYAGHLCNLYGMDTISVGATLALACELSARGLLTRKDTGGLEIHYGDPQGMLRLVEMTARRQGFGDLLAQGSAALAERFGAPELAVTVNRLEVPMHDPRAFHGMAVTYALSPRGACHMQGDMYGLDTGQGAVEELGLIPGDRFESSLEKGRTSARMQAWRTVYNALTVCQFENPGADLILSALNAATGWKLNIEDLLTLGKRILTLKRLINLRRGLTPLSDRLPDLLLKPLADGGAQDKVPDLAVLLAGAYAEFGWDPQTGKPAEHALIKLGI